ncbi:enoyl-CoA hydratase/isomerase family protein [Pelagibacterium sp. 26DY04]|uniref:enoyl-CoA hydratase/isomerase family protein n=1 Tax=Pelagibacterium sp. 26DY04 TaxID=2967130 RepID=UPI002815C7AE|nr:enoyl-CoA hydratase/isomerase family protein [Pelagibacterium sp. 26DY04]WMT86742.1 enoyl-CoA hydratase/isomerase family protein [Pelagibacterium sp. 26DY04]
MDDISISIEGACGIIRLARPRAINALSADMIAAVRAALDEWDEDERVRAVLIEGEGEKGLCAGGDVRATRELALVGDTRRVSAFFADEYDMNGLIATYPKPIVALQHGIVMGGGIGISSHARYRIATASSRFAMPEGAIGFFCDVGVNAILYKTAQARALAFLMSGQTVAVADAIALGLADAAVPEDALAGLRARVIEAAQAGDPDTAITALIQSESIDPGEASFCGLADSLAPVFAAETVGKIVENLLDLAEEGDPGAAALHAAIARQCPTSLAAIVISHRRARQLRDVRAILEDDLALAKHMALRPDFAEGVRAVLIDKDRNPQWQPARLADVDSDALEKVLGEAALT